jgi:hypothetical protein
VRTAPQGRKKAGSQAGVRSPSRTTCRVRHRVDVGPARHGGFGSSICVPPHPSAAGARGMGGPPTRWRGPVRVGISFAHPYGPSVLARATVPGVRFGRCARPSSPSARLVDCCSSLISGKKKKKSTRRAAMRDQDM